MNTEGIISIIATICLIAGGKFIVSYIKDKIKYRWIKSGEALIGILSRHSWIVYVHKNAIHLSINEAVQIKSLIFSRIIDNGRLTIFYDFDDCNWLLKLYDPRGTAKTKYEYNLGKSRSFKEIIELADKFVSIHVSNYDLDNSKLVKMYNKKVDKKYNCT